MENALEMKDSTYTVDSNSVPTCPLCRASIVSSYKLEHLTQFFLLTINNELMPLLSVDTSGNKCKLGILNAIGTKTNEIQIY